MSAEGKMLDQLEQRVNALERALDEVLERLERFELRSEEDDSDG